MQLFRHQFIFPAIFIITFIFFGCTKKTTYCTVDFKIDGKYEIVFYDTQKTITNGRFAEFNQTTKTDIKNADILKYKKIDEIHRVDNLTNKTFNLNADTIYQVYSIKSTLIIDSVNFNGSQRLFRNEGINHTVTAHSSHEITEIINYTDTLNWTATTNLNFNFSGQVKGKSNDLLVYYLIEKELAGNYLPDIMTAIMDKNKFSFPESIVHHNR